MAAPLPFRVPDLKRAVKAAQDMGLPVSGFRITPDGSIHVETQRETKADEADGALESWMRRHG